MNVEHPEKISWSRHWYSDIIQNSLCEHSYQLFITILIYFAQLFSHFLCTKHQQMDASWRAVEM